MQSHTFHDAHCHPAFVATAALALNLVSFVELGAQQDCRTGISVCRQTYVQNQSFAGIGLIQEAQGTCLANGESSSSWYIFTAQSSGSLTFMLNSPLDYDFALYNITNAGCAAVPGSIPVRCNFSGTNGNTGLNAPTAIELPPLAVGAGGNPFMPGVDVTAGQTYALLVNNFNNNQNGYTLTFGGTATIADTVPPTTNSASLDPRLCMVTITPSEPISCSSIAANGSDFQVLSPQGVNVVSASGNGCGTFASSISLGIRLTESETCGAWTIQPKIGSDGNTLLDICGNALTSTRSLAIATPQKAVPSLSLPATTFCAGSPVIANGSASEGEVNYFWAVAESDANWNVIGRECSDWFSGQAGTMDIAKFGQDRGCPLLPGRYYRVKLAVQSCCTGWSETVQLIQTWPAPPGNAGPDKALCCGQGPVVIGNGGFVPGHFIYEWTTPDGTVVSTRPTTAVSPSQATTYTLKVTDQATRCSTTDAVTVTPMCRPQVSLNLAPPSADCCDSSQTIVATTSEAESIRWNPGGQTTNQITVSPSSSTTYTATVRNACYSAWAEIKLDPKALLSGAFPVLFNPGSFTPNGDGNNDVYEIIAFEGAGAGPMSSRYNATEYEFEIYNRWGERIFHNTGGKSCNGFPNGTIRWDGRVNGQVVQQDVYVWKLRLKNCDQNTWTQTIRRLRWVCTKRGLLGRCRKGHWEEYDERSEINAVTVVR